MGIAPYSDDRRMNPGDNGIYVVDGWKIVDRILPYEGFVEEDEHDFDGMLRALDESMPEAERLGALLDSTEVATSELELGDEAAHIVLDMLADGSDYSNFGPEDYFMLPQLEGGYVLGRISKPPVPLSGYTLEMRFGGETVLVETDAGLDAGTITYRGERREAAF